MPEILVFRALSLVDSRLKKDSYYQSTSSLGFANNSFPLLETFPLRPTAETLSETLMPSRSTSVLTPEIRASNTQKLSHAAPRNSGNHT